MSLEETTSEIAEELKVSTGSTRQYIYQIHTKIRTESKGEVLEKVALQLPEVPKVQYEFRKAVNVVRKDDVNQSNVYLGHIGGLRSDPDCFALIVINRILGGGFTSRLFKNVR